MKYNCLDGVNGTQSLVFCNSIRESGINESVGDDNISAILYPYKPFMNLDPNQLSLQSQDLRDELNRYKNGRILSFKPIDNVDIGMRINGKGVNELQMNIKY